MIKKIFLLLMCLFAFTSYGEIQDTFKFKAKVRWLVCGPNSVHKVWCVIDETPFQEAIVDLSKSNTGYWTGNFKIYGITVMSQITVSKFDKSGWDVHLQLYAPGNQSSTQASQFTKTREVNVSLWGGSSIHVPGRRGVTVQPILQIVAN